MTDFFSFQREQQGNKHQPLSERIRPKALDEFIGQKHIVGEGKLLNRLILADKLTSMIFYGPPGTGKTTLASIIADTTDNNYKELSAVTAGVKELKQIIEMAEEELNLYNKKTILFVDEIHRFNKSQQDVLLPFVEKGIIILIGATTENPLFEVNKSLLSRSRVIEFYDLTKEDLNEVVDRVLADTTEGLGDQNIVLDDRAREFLINHSEGDARNLINTLELAVITTPEENGKRIIDVEVLSNCIQQVNLRYDKKGDMHYDIISAYIKTIRASQVDAAIYYLALMLESGEDPLFIARRLVIAASEDIGLADSNALSVAIDVFEAVKFLGMPEAGIPLAQGTVYLAAAPKSNTAYMAINNAIKDVKSTRSLSVPKNLRNVVVGDRKEDEKYIYNHNYEDGIVDQKYMEEDRQYYFGKEVGEEKILLERLKRIKD